MDACGQTLHALQIGMFWEQAGTAGGLDRAYKDILQGLPSAGICVTGIVLGPRAIISFNGGTVHGSAPPDASLHARLLGIRRAVQELKREKKFDLVATHFALYTVAALDQLRDYPLVVHFHGPWSGESAAEGESRLSVGVKRQIEALVYRRAKRVIVLSRAFGDLVSREFNVAQEVVQVVPGQIDVERFRRTETREEARSILGLPMDRPIVLTLRRLVRRMGIDRLIAAMAEVRRIVPEALLCIGGSGNRQPHLQRQAREAGLSGHVRFLGFVPEDELPILYRAADINIVPTVALEGFGLTAAEALAAGTPTLVTPVGGLPEVVAPLSSDLVFRSAASADMAAAITAALRGEIRLPDEVACRTYANERFSPAVALARIADVYREIVG
jgi:glycogen synthase